MSQLIEKYNEYLLRLLKEKVKEEKIIVAQERKRQQALRERLNMRTTADTREETLLKSTVEKEQLAAMLRAF